MEKSKFKHNWPLVGNSHIVEFLSKSIANDNIAGTYIFSGPSDLGKTTIARYFSQILLCQNRKKKIAEVCGICPSCKKFFTEKNKQINNNDLISGHSDFNIIKRGPDKKNISIEQARDFIRKMNISSFLGGWKVGIVKRAEKLSIEAMNALLKTLEEPKNKSVIILTVDLIENLPATIVSRSQVIHFLPISTSDIYDYLAQDIKISRTQAKEFAALSLGRPALAIKYIENRDFFSFYRQSAEIFLDFLSKDLISCFKIIEEIVGKKSGQDLVKEISKIINIWQGIARDLLLIKVGARDLIQNKIIARDMEKHVARFDYKKLMGLSENLRKAKEYIRANVNPRLALESVVTGI